MTHETEAYCAIDFSPSGAAAADLFAKLPTEARLGQLALSDVIGSTPGNMTQGMCEWYEGHIAPVRSSALEGVQSVLNGIDTKANGKPVFVEREKDKAEDDLLKAKRDAVKSVRDTRKTEFTRLEKIQESEDKTRDRYETLRNTLDREPRQWNSFLYVGLLMIIGLAELAINWEAFNAIKFFTPAVATGTALILGFALAASSHYTGSVIRQYKSLFDPANDDMDRFAGWKMIGMAASTLTIALGLVAFSRFYYLQQVASSNIFGDASIGLLKTVGGSMMSNILVWMVGVLIAYMAHDQVPEFPAALKDLERFTKKREALQNSLDKPLARPFSKAEAQYKNDMERIKQRSASLASVPTQVEARGLMQKVMEQDAKVKALLATYRHRLKNDGRHDAVFLMDEELGRTDNKIELNHESYSQKPLVMKYV
ncbi:hypothetical protein SAMN04488004_107210 [Loktanella salsilacus]|uniref:Uncharacterized protein n=1 Tax=Loktanella salsilacus TaxID=195913 RepID=A0A1I4EV85_9RHOB|nr:flagellar protein FliT [Loktanella salsilacus]SFL09618.1 hypothetical protein SAMN04488004_107210 [Loktanella salsilacus]